VLTIGYPLPPGCLQTVWGDDARYVQTYWRSFPQLPAERAVYNTFDWGLKDADGYYFILGRTDDVINVAGHRLGTREIEEAVSSHAGVAEVAVVGVADALKGQVARAFVVARDAQRTSTLEGRQALEAEIMKTVDGLLGALARPARVDFVSALPKTRSGKLLRRAIQAVCEGRGTGDLTTIDDPTAIQQLEEAVKEQRG
jgi:propionyl-CoA synthetase